MDRVGGSGNTISFSFSFGPASRLRFRIVSADEGELIGVVVEGPGVADGVRVIHDFRTGGSWPARSDDKRGFDERKGLLRTAFDRLESENPHLEMKVWSD